MYLANCSNSEDRGFSHGKLPKALERAAYFLPLGDVSVYLLITSWKTREHTYFTSKLIQNKTTIEGQNNDSLCIYIPESVYSSVRQGALR